MCGFWRRSSTARCRRGSASGRTSSPKSSASRASRFPTRCICCTGRGWSPKAAAAALRSRQLDPQRIRQLYEVRGAIDALAARLAAQRARTDAEGRAARGRPAGRARHRQEDAAGETDRARRRFSPRDLPSGRQSRDRGNDRAAMAAYAPLDGDRAGRARLSRQRLEPSTRRLWSQIFAGNAKAAEAAALAHAQTAGRLTEERLKAIDEAA